MSRFPARSTFLRAFVLGAFLTSPLSAQDPSDWYVNEWQLWRVDVDGTNLQPIDTTPGRRCGSPVWSPDGTRIAYDVSTINNSTTQVAVAKADGSQIQILTAGGIPCWSPDGEMIAFLGGGLQVMNADGGGCEKLSGNGFSARWSPRGNFIATKGGSQLMVFDLESGRNRAVPVSIGPICHGFGISPDARRYALGTVDNGLWLATMDETWTTAKCRQLVQSGSAYHTSWAPDGKRVVFAWKPNPAALTQLYTLNVDANDPPELLPGIDTTHENVNPSWSPDGRSIVFSRPGKTILNE